MRALLSEGKERFGTPIPEPLVSAFHLDELQQLMRQMRALGGELATCLDDGKIAFCVCRMCQGEGCHACSGRGFQTVVQYKALPGEYRAEG